MPKIDEVRLRAVRGVRTEVLLALRGESVIVRGDNGTGKSSIVRGLQWALRGQEPPLASGGTAEESFRTHVLEDPNQARVSIQFAGTSTLVAAPDGTSGDEKALIYRDACIRANPFLVRSQLLNFLQDRPSDRFRYLEAFLDLGQADEIRDTMARAAEAAKTDADRKANARTVAVERVVAQLPESHRPINKSWSTTIDALSRLGSELAVVEQHNDGDDLWGRLTEAATKARRFAENDRLPKQRALLVRALHDLSALALRLQATLPEVRELRDSRKRHEAAAADASRMQVLEPAVAYFEGHNEDVCPICEQGVQHDQILASLRARLSTLEQFRNITNQLELVVQEWLERLQRFQLVQVSAAEALAAAEVINFTPTDPIPPGFAQLAGAAGTARFQTELSHTDGAALLEWMRAAIAGATARLTEIFSGLPPEGSTASLTAFANAAAEVTRQRPTVEAADSAEPIARREATVLAAVADAIRRARQDVAKNLLEEISATVGEYYRTIHPRGEDGDVTDAPAIDIQRSGAGTAYVRGNFNGKRVDDPRWVYSDGHLDTVGICVFLAMRKFRSKRANDSRLMVLDDIVLSIDLVHAPRLLDVLRDHFSDHQVLIFTHNGIFFDLCVSRLPSFRRKVITSWSIDYGPRLGDHSTSLERLEASVAASSSPREIAMDLMALIDEWLGEARFVFSLSVQAKRGEQYTLTEIWQPFVKALEEMEKKLKTPIGNAKQLIGRLRDVTRIRNALGAHENQFAREYPLTMIQELGRATTALVRTLYCTGCGQFASPLPNRESPFSIHCRCQAIRYTTP